MATYALGLAKTKDAELESKMIAGMMPLFGRYEMEMVATPTTKITEVEGTWSYDTLFLIKFPDRETAEAFVKDPDFVALEEQREAAGEASLVLFDGLDS